MTGPTDVTPPRGSAVAAAPDPQTEQALRLLRPVALVISILTALGAAFVLSRVIDTLGAFALRLTMGALASAVAVTVVLRLFALRDQPGRQRRFRWYAVLETAVVAGLLGRALLDRQPDLFPLLVVLSVVAVAACGTQAAWLWTRRGDATA